MAPAPGAAMAAAEATVQAKAWVKAEAAEEIRAADSGPEEAVYAPHAVTNRLTHRARNAHR